MGVQGVGAGLKPKPAGPDGVAPRHIAVIMDGNGRWAQSRGLPRAAGHRAGAQAVRRTIEAAAAAGSKASSKTTACSCSEAASSTKASVASKTVLAHLKVAALPLVAVELSDGVPGIVYCLEGNDTRALWSAIWCDVDICAKN